MSLRKVLKINVRSKKNEERLIYSLANLILSGNTRLIYSASGFRTVRGAPPHRDILSTPGQLSPDGSARSLRNPHETAQRMRHLRTRTHECHVSFEDVDQLRQLIDFAVPQNPSHPRNPRIIATVTDGPALPFIVHHGAKLEIRKGRNPLPIRSLFEKDRPRRIQLDQNGREEEQRKQKNKCSNRDHNVKQTLH